MGYNVLIVDDSSIARKTIVKVLSLTDIEVGSLTEAANGQEGLDAIKNNWIDLIFLDINMPVMDGIQFLTKLRSEEKNLLPHVVVVSTEGSEERQEALKSLGITAFLRKPTTPEALAGVVNELLAKGQS